MLSRLLAASLLVCSLTGCMTAEEEAELARRWREDPVDLGQGRFQQGQQGNRTRSQTCQVMDMGNGIYREDCTPH